MKRLNCLELHERSWCPVFLRDYLTDFLSFFNIYSGVYAPAALKVLELIQKSKENHLVDICSGNGLYMRRFLKDLNYPQIKITLTDLHPHRNSEFVNITTNGTINYLQKEVSALSAIKELHGIHLMFSAMHHFDEKELSKILQCAIDNEQTVAFFDYSQRKIITELFAVICGVILLLLTSPLIHPFSWKRLLFTYIIPLVPIILITDSIISRLRAYRLSELNDLLQKLDCNPSKYLICAGEYRYYYYCSVKFIIGIKKHNA